VQLLLEINYNVFTNRKEHYSELTAENTKKIKAEFQQDFNRGPQNNEELIKFLNTRHRETEDDLYLLDKISSKVKSEQSQCIEAINNSVKL
jgi:hypothetical protein